MKSEVCSRSVAKGQVRSQKFSSSQKFEVRSQKFEVCSRSVAKGQV
ncbi:MULTISPECIES: hypothetical protein [unclassified Moorena]|nr:MULTISPECIES: hypothetical protein [unclassified Moorena]NEP36950.1 hypothetical protein [Moorena sp. SIO3B2]NER85862.1 hypothetical protein [Moorena sp. SIO3A2]